VNTFPESGRSALQRAVHAALNDASQFLSTLANTPPALTFPTFGGRAFN